MLNFFKKKAPTEAEAIRVLVDLASTARLESVREKGIVIAIMVLIDKTGSELAPYAQHQKSVAEFIVRIEERILDELSESRAKEFMELGIPIEILSDKSNEISAAKRVLVDSKNSGCLRWHLNHEDNIIIDYP